jgi:hypothetical protein
MNRTLGRRRRIFDDRPRFDQEHPGLEQAGCNGVPGPRQDPGVRLPGHTHALGRRVLVQSLEVGKPDGFQFVEGDRQRVGPSGMLPDRPESTARQAASNASWNHGSRHLL